MPNSRPALRAVHASATFPSHARATDDPKERTTPFTQRGRRESTRAIELLVVFGNVSNPRGLLVAGAPELEAEADRRLNGIPLDRRVRETLRKLAAEYRAPVLL